MTKTPDVFRAVCLLFLRILQRDSTEAPAVLVAAGKGSRWMAVVFIGAPPAELLAHYLRAGSGDLPARVATLGDSHSHALGDSGEEALQLLRADLTNALDSRLRTDAEAWQNAVGAPWEVPDFPVAAPVQPGAPEPEQRRALPARRLPS